MAFRIASLAAWALTTLTCTWAAPSVAENMSPLRRTNPAVLFRLGSGASSSARPIDTPALQPVSGHETVDADKHSAPPIVYTLSRVITACILALLYLMQPATVPRTDPQGNLPGMITGGRDFNYRIPPPWSPEYEHTYSFRAYMTDLSLWIMLTDLQPHQQCAAIIMRLGGAAREMARMITPQEMIFGGFRNGQQLDPVTYLLGALHNRFAALEEESRLACMTEMLAFQRKPNESINALLARYETVKQRAAIEGQFVMSIEGCSLQVLRACNVQASQLFILLQPFQGQLPQTEPQFQQLCQQLRRFGHMQEGVRGNVAAALQGGMHQARPGTYFGEIALISSNNRRTATVQTKSYSNIGHITQETFNEIITIFPDVKNAMKQNFIQYQDRFRCWQKMMLLNIDYFRDLSIETYEELIFVLRNEVF